MESMRIYKGIQYCNIDAFVAWGNGRWRHLSCQHFVALCWVVAPGRRSRQLERYHKRGSKVQLPNAQPSSVGRRDGALPLFSVRHLCNKRAGDVIHCNGGRKGGTVREGRERNMQRGHRSTERPENKQFRVNTINLNR